MNNVILKIFLCFLISVSTAYAKKKNKKNDKKNDGFYYVPKESSGTTSKVSSNNNRNRTVSKKVEKPIKTRRVYGSAPSNAKVTELTSNRVVKPIYVTVSRGNVEMPPVRLEDQVLSFKNRTLFINIPNKMIPSYEDRKKIQEEIRERRLQELKAEKEKKKPESRLVKQALKTMGSKKDSEPEVEKEPEVEVPSLEDLLPHVEVFINFDEDGEDEASISLGKARLSGNLGVVNVDPRIIESLAQSYSQSTGFINVKVGDKWAYKNLKGSNKVYFGGNPDYLCNRPAIIVDYHGTINEGQCTTSQLNKLIEDKNLSVFVASSSGFLVYDEVQKLGIKRSNLKNVFVLGAETDVSNDPGTEKAIRIVRKLSDTGICLLGFAGDTPAKEGFASKYLDIPYLAVHQEDKTKYRDRKRKSEWYTCEKEVYSNPRKITGSNCPDSPTKIRRQVDLAKCKIEKEDEKNNRQFKGGITVHGAEPPPTRNEVNYKWELIPEGKSKYTYRCKEGSFTGDTRPDVYCFDRYANQQPARFNSKQNPFCLEAHRELFLNIKEETYQEALGDYPSLDINDYPENSIYAHDWCEMAEKMDEVFFSNIPLKPFVVQEPTRGENEESVSRNTEHLK